MGKHLITRQYQYQSISVSQVTCIIPTSPAQNKVTVQTGFKVISMDDYDH